jgi:hypothetical protein
MGHAIPVLAVLGVIWLVSMVFGAWAIRGSRRNPRRHAWFYILLALGAIGVGSLAFWPALSPWLGIVYSWHEITIELSWFFVLPVLLGIIGLVSVLRKKAPKSEPINLPR